MSRRKRTDSRTSAAPAASSTDTAPRAAAASFAAFRSAMESPRRALFPDPAAPSGRWIDLSVLLLILAVALAIQWRGMTSDIIERVHGWRQAQTDMTSRNFARDGMNPFVARVDYIGDGQMQLEFPLYQYLTAICYRLFGIAPVWGRLIALLFGAASTYLVYRIGAMVWSRRTGLLAAGVFTFSPINLYFNRAVMPDSSTICFTLLSLLGFLRYFRDFRRGDLILAALSIFMALAGKPPIVVTIFPPLAVAMWLAVGWRFWRRRDLVIALVAALAAFAGWMKYQSYINNERCDNLGIEFTNAGEFNAHLKAWYFGTPRQRSESRTYRRIWERMPDWVGHCAPALAARADQAKLLALIRSLGRDVPPQLAAAVPMNPIAAALEWAARYLVAGLGLIGLALSWRRPMQRILHVWAFGGLAYVLIFLNVNYVHNYYQMPIIPIFALAAAVGWDRLIAGITRLAPRLAPSGAPALAAGIGAALTLMFLSAQAWGGFAVLRDYNAFPAREMWEPGQYKYWDVLQQQIEFGREIHGHLPDNGGLLALAGDGWVADVRDPQLLYYIDRRGFIIQAPVKDSTIRDKNKWVRDHLMSCVEVAIQKGCRTLVIAAPATLVSTLDAHALTRRFRMHYRDPQERYWIFDLTADSGGAPRTG